MANPRRVALLVIHGMGEQRQLELTDSFVSGLAGRLVHRGAEVELEHRVEPIDPKKRSVRSFVRIRPKAGGAFDSSTLTGPNPIEHIDVHEVYWASRVRGLAKVRAVLSWLGLTSISPLAWRRQALIMAPTTKARWLYVVREAWRAIALPLLASLIIGLFVYAFAQRDRLGDSGADFQSLLELVPGFWNWAALIVAVFAGVLGLVTLGAGFWKRGTPLRDDAQRFYELWLRRTKVISVGALAISVVLFTLSGVSMVDVWDGAWAVVANRGLVAALVAVALLVPLTKFFNGSVGDVMIYMEGADSHSEFADVRTEILDESVNRLAELMALPSPEENAKSALQYDSVFVAAHSLGSVIAYDTINHITVYRQTLEDKVHEIRGEHADVDAAFSRLAGLLSFGSPLDKIYYFFRYRVKASQVVRSQLLENLLRFRMKPSHASCGPLIVAPPGGGRAEPTGFVWWNAYNFYDPLGHQLDFYELDRQHRILPNLSSGREHDPARLKRSLRGRPTPNGHTLYWGNRHFFDVALEWLSQPTIISMSITTGATQARLTVHAGGFTPNGRCEVWVEGAEKPAASLSVTPQGDVDGVVPLDLDPTRVFAMCLRDVETDAWTKYTRVAVAETAPAAPSTGSNGHTRDRLPAITF